MLAGKSDPAEMGHLGAADDAPWLNFDESQNEAVERREEEDGISSSTRHGQGKEAWLGIDSQSNILRRLPSFSLSHAQSR